MNKFVNIISCLVFLILVLIPNYANASELNDGLESYEDTISNSKTSLYTGYVGGVMIHMGYASGGELLPSGYTEPIAVKGVTMGIGGRMMIGLGDKLRVGGEGYISSMSYGENREVTLGWGGLSAEYVLRFGAKCSVALGATLGGGSYTNQCSLTTPTNDDTAHPTVWQSSALFLAVPYIGMEYAFGTSLRGIVKVDWITAPFAMQTRNDFSSGPRIYIGVMFSKMK